MAELREYHPGVAERTRNWVADTVLHGIFGMEPRDASTYARNRLDYMPFIDVPLGLLQGYEDAQRADEAFSRGDYAQGTLQGAAGLFGGALAAVPFIPASPVRKAFKNMADVPSLRGVPVEEATAYAAREPHLIPAGAGSEGKYVGGARDVKSKQGLNKVRASIDETLDFDPRGGDWYDRYRAGVTEITGGDPTQSTWMSNMGGMYSAGVSPEGELGFNLKDLMSGIAYGAPVKAARPAQQAATVRALEARDPWQLQLGEKTGEYARRINPVQEGPPTATGVNDFRWFREHGYTDAAGNPVTQQTGSASHKFVDYETALAVKRANERNLAGRSDWTGEQIQAVPWVVQKARDFHRRGKNSYDKRAKQALGGAPSQAAIDAKSWDMAMNDANRTIADFFPKHTAYGTYEAQPGAMTGHLPGLLGASEETRGLFAADPRSTWAFAPGGRDALYAGMGIPDTGYNVRVRPTESMQGMYTPPGGEVEFNPGEVARPLVAFDAGKVKSVPEADRSILDAVEAFRAYVGGQGAGAWHKAWTGGQPGKSPDVFATKVTPSPASAEELQSLQSIGSKYSLPDVVDVNEGATLTNFGRYDSPEYNIWGDWLGGVAPSKKPMATKDRKALMEELKGTGLFSEAVPAKVDSGYIGFEDAWEKGVGSGAVTSQFMDVLNQLPEGTRKALDANPYAPEGALRLMERDAEWANKVGATREDLQNARRIIGEGPGWISRLEKALKSGAVLPAVGLALLSVPSGDEPQS